MPRTDKHDDTFTLTEDEQPAFYALLDKVHDALVNERGCFHPKFQPSQCALVTKRLWQNGVKDGGKDK